MQPPSFAALLPAALLPAALLDVWEQGQNRPRPYQALLLLLAATPDAAPEDLAALSLGRRDAALLTLRERMFGPRLSGVADCPRCGERLEMEFDVADLRVQPGEATDASGELAVPIGERVLRFRLPNSLDLLTVLEEVQTDADVEATRRVLLQRCLQREDEDASMPEALDEAAIVAVESAMAAADPQADLQLELTCPVCAHLWELAFDVVSYIWAEVDNRARRLLRDVHLLASAYGWAERDILALSPQRRGVYLSLLGA